MNFKQFIRAKNTGMFPNRFIQSTTNKTNVPVKYVCPCDQTAVGYFMSTFFYKRITYKGITYPSVEHAYQATKFKFTDNPIIAKKFRHGGSVACPRKAREMGTRKGMNDLGVKLDRFQWKKHKHDIFKTIINRRRAQDHLFNNLLQTPVLV